MTPYALHDRECGAVPEAPVFSYFALTAVLSFLSALLWHWRIHVRDRDDRTFVRHVFDNTLSTDAVDGYARLLRSRRSLKDDDQPPE